MSDKQKGEEMGQDADDLFFAVSRSLHCPSLRWVGPQVLMEENTVAGQAH